MKCHIALESWQLREYDGKIRLLVPEITLRGTCVLHNRINGDPGFKDNIIWLCITDRTQVHHFDMDTQNNTRNDSRYIHLTSMIIRGKERSIHLFEATRGHKLTTSNDTIFCMYSPGQNDKLLIFPKFFWLLAKNYYT